MPKRVLYVTGDMSLADMKVRAKKYNATINDWFLTSITRAIQQYYGDKMPQPNIRCETAMSCHVEEDLENFEPSNRLIAEEIFMDCKDELSASVIETKRALAPWKNIDLIMSWEMIDMWKYNYLPLFLSRRLLEDYIAN